MEVKSGRPSSCYATYRTQDRHNSSSCTWRSRLFCVFAHGIQNGYRGKFCCHHSRTWVRARYGGVREGNTSVVRCRHVYRDFDEDPSVWMERILILMKPVTGITVVTDLKWYSVKRDRKQRFGDVFLILLDDQLYDSVVFRFSTASVHFSFHLFRGIRIWHPSNSFVIMWDRVSVSKIVEKVDSPLFDRELKIRARNFERYTTDVDDRVTAMYISESWHWLYVAQTVFYIMSKYTF